MNLLFFVFASYCLNCSQEVRDARNEQDHHKGPDVRHRSAIIYPSLLHPLAVVH